MLFNEYYFNKKDGSFLKATGLSFSPIDNTRYLNFKQTCSPNGFELTFTANVDDVAEHFLKFSDLISGNLLRIPVNTCVLVEERFIPQGLPPIKHNIAENDKISVVFKCLEILRKNVEYSLVQLGYKVIVRHSADLVAHKYVNDLSSISSNIEITFAPATGAISVKDFNTVMERLSNILKSSEYLNTVSLAYCNKKEAN